MKSFWGYTKGKNYDIGCTGGSVCVYDKSGKELAVFKGLKYAYFAAFVPFKNKFIVKTNEGTLALYSLDEMKLEKKLRYSKTGGVFTGFCFSPDGSKFYNIEVNGLQSKLVIYDTDALEPIESHFEDESNKFFCHIEPDGGQFVLLGYMRNRGIADYGFVIRFNGKELYGMNRLSLKDFDYANWHKHLELSGFTEKALKWCPLEDRGDYKPLSLKDYL